MSIIKNTRGSDNAFTAKRFVANQPINSEGYYPKEYVELNGYKLVLDGDKIKFDANSTLITKAQILEDTTNTLFGGGDGTCKIVCDSTGNVIWEKENETYPLYSVARDNKVHTYGYIKTQNGIRPFYDGHAVGVEISTCDMCSVVIAGSAYGEPLDNTTQDYAIRVYEVAGNLFSITDNNYHIFHWYAAAYGVSGTTPYMYETRSNVSIPYIPFWFSTQNKFTNFI